MSHASLTHRHSHHFLSLEAEIEALKQGMWIFLVTEVLMFGGLFVAYTIFRGLYPEMFHEAHKMLDVGMGLTNTIVLITSSVTMVMAVLETQDGRKRGALVFLSLTFLLAAVFLFVKYLEYSHKISHGLLPGGLFANHELSHPKAPLFFSLYFVMTGLHGIHVLVGMCLILWLIISTSRGKFGATYHTPTELVGFYWHFVDMVWIFLFPLFYLVG